MNIVEPIWVNQFIEHTYSCIKGRGIHKCAKDVRKALDRDIEGTKYCLKLDITKFYPSINHDILKHIIRKKIKDKRLLDLLDSIIDSADGVPIGNYLSQFFANLYLSDFDHWVKEVLKVKYYFRYADDIVILGDDKERLHELRLFITKYLDEKLKLSVKPNYQVFPLDKRGLDFVGYRFWHSHTMLRKSIKKRLFKTIYKSIEHESKEDLKKSLNSYFGWLKYCNSKNLLRKIYDITGLHYSNWIGEQQNICRFYDKYIYLYNIQDHNKYFEIQFIYGNKSWIIKSKNKRLRKSINNKKVIKLIKYV